VPVPDWFWAEKKTEKRENHNQQNNIFVGQEAQVRVGLNGTTQKRGFSMKWDHQDQKPSGGGFERGTTPTNG